MINMTLIEIDYTLALFKKLNLLTFLFFDQIYYVAHMGFSQMF